MTSERYVDPPPFIQEWETDDETCWPKPPPCLDDNVDYFSFHETVQRGNVNLFPDKVLDIQKDLRDQLKQLNHSILVAYLAIIQKQMNQPFQIDIIKPYVDHILFLIQVMHQALNAYRPYQAKKYYSLLFEKQVEQKEKLYQQLKAIVDEANNKYKDFNIPKKSMDEC